jgi:hypothetical protein
MTRPLFGKTPSDKVRPIVVVNFESYHPANKTLSAEARAGGPLRWIRWETNSHRDADLLDLPAAERWLWPVLLGLAGRERKRDDGLRVIRLSPTQLAREADLTEEQVRHALAHLWKCGRIRYTVKGGAKVAQRHREGGEGMATVPTVPTTPYQPHRTPRAGTGSDEPKTGLSPIAGALERVRAGVRVDA